MKMLILTNIDRDLLNVTGKYKVIALMTKLLNITNNLIKCANETIPNKNVVIRPRDLPWFHNDIRKHIRKRDRLHRTAKRIK